MFLGTHSPRLDEKGRIILPAKFREELASGLVLTRGQERCIYVFSEKEFARVHEQMREAPISSKQARDYIRGLQEASRLHPHSWAMWRQRAGVTEQGLAAQPDFWARVDALGERRYYPRVDMKGMP